MQLKKAPPEGRGGAFPQRTEGGIRGGVPINGTMRGVSINTNSVHGYCGIYSPKVTVTVNCEPSRCIVRVA